MFIAELLGRRLHAVTHLPQTAEHMAVNALIDLCAASIAGRRTETFRIAAQAGRAIWGAGDSAVWFAGASLAPSGAAFVNASAASALDLDDGHRAAAGHPGAAVIPAVLAAGGSEGAPAGDLLRAIAIGYEIAVRCSAARDLGDIDTLVSGRWCGQGVAAAVAWLKGLPPPAIAQAIALAGASAPNLSAVAYSTDMGNHLKEGIPWATVTGLAAVELAALGYSGPLDLFDNAATFDRDMLLGAFDAPWAIEGIYFKPYSCCRWAHAAIDATLALMAEHGIAASDIDAIAVETFARALQLNNKPAPQTLEDAQYSVPFCVALGAMRGSAALLPMTADRLSDTSVINLARRITMCVDPDLDRLFSTKVPATVELSTARGLFRRSVRDPWGEPDNPMPRDDLVAKLRTVATHNASDAQIDRLLAALLALEAGSSGPLFHALASPLDDPLPS